MRPATDSIPTEVYEAAVEAYISEEGRAGTSAAIRAAIRYAFGAGRAQAAEEAEDRAGDALVATRQMFNEANARLRALLLAALGAEDDGKISLTGYVHALIADRDAAATRGRAQAAADIRAYAAKIREDAWTPSTGVALAATADQAAAIAEGDAEGA